MSDRLIIPHKPSKHHHRLVAAMVLGALAVAGVWGWQIKMTFAKYVSDRNDQVLAETKATFKQVIEDSREEQQLGTEAIADLVRTTLAEQAAKEAILADVQAAVGTEPALVAPTTTPIASDPAVVIVE